MQVEEELAGQSPAGDTLLAVGVFDGVHLGHRYLLSLVVDAARRQGLLSGVVTFRRHPRAVLSPGTALPYLTDVASRAQHLKELGIDVVVTLTFTPELARLTASEFVTLLKERLRMRGLVVGPDFALGRGREGDVEMLRRLGEEMDFSVTVVSPRLIQGEVVSSTSIRAALGEGDMGRVTKLLGRPHSVHAPVAPGAGRGVGMGFPTANLDIDPKQALPPEGVYATWAHVDGRAYQSMTNIGRNPTFGENQRTVEVFLLDFQGDLYGRDLRIEFVERLRDEKRFDTVDDLKKQIAIDVEQGRAILSAQGVGKA